MTRELLTKPKQENCEALNRKAQTVYAKATGSARSPKWDLVKQYLPLVKSMTSRMRIYFPAHVDVEDIYSVALSGLISATQQYDADRFASFGAYATIRVRGSLLDELRRMDWMSREQRVKAKQYRKQVEALEQKLQRAVTDGDIRKELKISKKEHEKIKDQSRAIYMINLDMDAGDEGNAKQPLHDTISDINQVDARDITEKKEMVDILRERMKGLPDEHKKILGMYYFKNMRLAEIAVVMNLTESRICQIHSKIVKDLRMYLKKNLAQ